MEIIFAILLAFIYVQHRAIVNAAVSKDLAVQEIIDRFVHNKVPERLQAKVTEPSRSVEDFLESGDDPVSLAEQDAERLAEEARRKING